MAITRAKKVELIQTYKDVLSASDGLIITSFTAMTVAQTQELRGKLREVDATYMVAKNTLMSIALEESDWPVPTDMLTGMNGIAFSQGNLPGLAGALLEATKDLKEKVSIKGGIMGGSPFEGHQLEAISKMPSLPEVQAQIIGMLVQPATGLVSVLDAANSGIVNVLQPGVSQVLNVLQAHIQQNLSEDAA